MEILEGVAGGNAGLFVSMNQNVFEIVQSVQPLLPVQDLEVVIEQPLLVFV
jgi:hypothetical protein